MPVLSSFDLSGRRALITGSSAGIGLALAQGLAQAGATVILNGRSNDKLQQCASNMRAQGLSVEVEVFDVTSRAAVRAGVAAAEARGALDIVINNAGMQRRGPLEHYSEDDWDALMRTNLDSVFHVSQIGRAHV